MPKRFWVHGFSTNPFVTKRSFAGVDRGILTVESVGETKRLQRRVSASGVGYSIFKRTLDCSAALFALILLLPLLILVSVLLLMTQGRPLLIKHRRIGKHAAAFQCLKFRSMVRDADKVLLRHLEECPSACAEWNATRKLKSDPRVTAVGRVLRRSSLDELPQLLNILKGDMSLVGPRPIVQSELKLYGASIGHYYKVRPGLTGLWQVSGRSDLSFEVRVGLDCEYVRTKSIVGDIKIIAKTFPAVLNACGSY